VRIAIVHDDLTQRGGAERVVEAMHEIWPEAPVFTSVYDPKGTFASFAKMDVRTSFMQKIPLASQARYNKLFLPLYPLAFETLDLRGYDVVVSSSTRFAHGILTTPETCHLCYCHSPSRFAWRYHEYITEGDFGRLSKIILQPLIHRIRLWDYIAAQRIECYIANSFNISRRIRKVYGRDSDVVYPPVDIARFKVESKPKGDYLLIVSRLLSYKKIDIAIEACNRLKIPLKIVGLGPDMGRLKAMAGPTIELLGRLPDGGQLAELYSNCRAFLFPGEEDFGIAPVEAMASGRPVIAYRAGGAIETVVEGQTGLFFDEPTPEALCDAITRLEKLSLDPAQICAHAETFSKEAFQRRLLMLVELRLAEHHARYECISPKQGELA
jgi:glycosyltransferase involved in cell wall biosynthesis